MIFAAPKNVAVPSVAAKNYQTEEKTPDVTRGEPIRYIVHDEPAGKATWKSIFSGNEKKLTHSYFKTITCTTDRLKVTDSDVETSRKLRGIDPSYLSIQMKEILTSETTAKCQWDYHPSISYGERLKALQRLQDDHISNTKNCDSARWINATKKEAFTVMMSSALALTVSPFFRRTRYIFWRTQIQRIDYLY